MSTIEASNVPKMVSPKVLWQWEHTKRRVGFLTFLGVSPSSDGDTVKELFEEVEKMAKEFVDNVSIDPVSWRAGERLNKQYFEIVVEALAASPHGLLRPQHLLQFFRNRFPHLWRQTAGTAPTAAVMKAIHIVLSSRKFLQVEVDVDPVTSDQRVFFFAIDYQSYPDAPAPGMVLQTPQDGRFPPTDGVLTYGDENRAADTKQRRSSGIFFQPDKLTEGSAPKTPKKVHMARSILRRALEESNGQNQQSVAQGSIKTRGLQRVVLESPCQCSSTETHDNDNDSTSTCSVDETVSTKDRDNIKRWQDYWGRCLDQEAPTYAFDLVGYVCGERLSRGFFPRVVNVFPRNLLLTAEQAVMECLSGTDVQQ